MINLTRIASFAAAAVATVGLAFSPAASAKGPKGPTIVDVAIALNTDGPFAGQFDTLIAAVLAADPIVFDTLSGNGKLTVFAPTDDAFAALNLIARQRRQPRYRLPDAGARLPRGAR